MINTENYTEEMERQRVQAVLTKFERNMDTLVGAPNTEFTLSLAQSFVNTYVEEMRALGYRMRGRWNIPSVSVCGSLIVCVPIEWERDGWKIVENY